MNLNSSFPDAILSCDDPPTSSKTMSPNSSWNLW